MRMRLYAVAVSLLISVPSIAQTSPSAEGPGVTVWVGASVSMFNPDYGCKNNSPFSCWGNQLIGFGPYVDTNSFLLGRIGAEGEARFLRWHGPVGLTEDTFMGGPRVRLWHHRALHATAKFLIGEARLNVSNNGVGTGNYFAYAPGGAVDYRVSRRLAARLDYEYQKWPTFRGASGNKGLTPNGFSVGVSYAIR